jgi:Calponin homology (CH) domain
MSLNWLNHHLTSKEIEVTELFSSIRDGLNLIYALEVCTGANVGKYNKRVMMDVQRNDNLAVALRFLASKGVATASISPQGLKINSRHSQR